MVETVVELYLARPLIGIVVLSVLVVGALRYSMRRYGDIANPISGAMATHVLVTCLVSAVAFYVWKADNPRWDRSLAVVATGSCVFVAAIVGGAITPAAWLERLVALPLGLDRRTSLRPPSRGLAMGAIAASATLFCLMAVGGGGGLKWFEDPRIAYLSNRAGVGVLWSAASWSLSIAVLSLIWDCRPLGRRALIVGAGALAGLAFGSKAVPLGLVVLAVLHHHLVIKRLPGPVIAVLVTLLVGAIAYLLWLRGERDDALPALRYFAEYTSTACRGIDLLGSAGAWFLGQAWTSSLWEYVPRAVAPSKPFAYGVGLLHEALAPGMAARGHTPGVPAWMLGFAELGWGGIAITGFAIGKFHDAVYAVVRRRSLNLPGFLICAQFVMYPVLIYSNAVSTLAIYWMLVVVLSRRHQGAGTGTREHEIVMGSAGQPNQAG